MQTLQGIDSEYVYLEDEESVLTLAEYRARESDPGWKSNLEKHEKRYKRDVMRLVAYYGTPKHPAMPGLPQ